MPTDHEATDKERVLNKSTLRTMSILDYMATVRSPVSISELSHSLSIPKSSVFNIVYTLVNGRYLEIDDQQLRTFRLGFKLFQTGITYLSNVELHQIAHPLLRELMTKLGETVHLATEDEKHLVFIDSVEADNSLIRSVARLGRSTSPMYCSGLGKALMAAWPDEELFKEFRGARFVQITPNTVKNFGELMDEIQRTRHQGYAFDNMESNEQLSCVACPLYDRTGRAVGAISCSVPAHRMDEKRPTVTEAVAETALRISQRLGFVGSRFYNEIS
jgi:DNA-binding IclR family transcriptional regulator